MYAFVFDLDDTLYDQIQPFKRAYEKNFPQYSDYFESFYVANRRISDQLFPMTESGELDLEEMRIKRVRGAFESLRIAVTEEEASRFQADYKGYQQRIELDSHMITILDLLKTNGVPLGLITNGPDDHQRMKISALELQKWFLDDAIITSGGEGVAKPESEIFRILERKRGLDPLSTYYIGDSYANDVVGAHNAGWKTIWLNKQNKSISAEQLQPTIRVNTYLGLEEVIKELVSG